MNHLNINGRAASLSAICLLILVILGNYGCTFNHTLEMHKHGGSLEEPSEEIKKHKRTLEMYKHGGSLEEPSEEVKKHKGTDVSQELLEAVRKGDLETLKRLKDSASEVNIFDQSKSLLYVAVECTSDLDTCCKLVSLLSEMGAKMMRNTDEIGATPLHAAVTRKETSDLLIDALLKVKDADINVKATYNNDTPLHYAADYPAEAIYQKLVKEGADEEAVNNDKVRPSDLRASHRRRKELKKGGNFHSST